MGDVMQVDQDGPLKCWYATQGRLATPAGLAKIPGYALFSEGT